MPCAFLEMKGHVLLEKLQISQLFLGNSNAFLVRSGKEAALIDGGLGNRQNRIFAEIGKMGLTPDCLKYIFVTHAHYDHVGSVKGIKQKLPHVQIVAQEHEAEKLKNGFSPVPAGTMWFSKPVSWLGCMLFRNCIRFHGFAVDISFSDRISLKLGNHELECFHTPGHTDGAMCIKIADEAVFVGDSVFHLLPGHFFPPFADDAEMLKISWQRIRSSGVRYVYPGHGRRFPLKMLPEI